MCRVQKDPAYAANFPKELDILAHGSGQDDERCLWHRGNIVEPALDGTRSERMRDDGLAVDAEDARFRPALTNSERDRSPDQAEPDNRDGGKWRISGHVLTPSLQRPTAKAPSWKLDVGSWKF